MYICKDMQYLWNKFALYQNVKLSHQVWLLAKSYRDYYIFYHEFHLLNYFSFYSNKFLVF